VDSDSKNIQPNETPEATLDRTRHLLARSRRTLDAADRRLGAHDDEEEQPPPGQRRES
jgi:hypothetical protein